MLKRALTLIWVVIFITACTSPTYQQNGTAIAGVGIGAAVGATAAGLSHYPMGEGALLGAAVGGAMGYYIQCHRPILEKLCHEGVQVIMVGDNVKIILHTDTIFENNTPRFNCAAGPIIKDVITFINGLEKIEVKVTGYTNCAGPPCRNLAISKAMADNLANYMWSHGLDARVLYSNGCGEEDPIASNMTSRGRAANRRIEITLRQLPL